MAKLVPDNESDYGYDLSAEDEDLLFQVADSVSPPPLPATANAPGLLAAAALDPGSRYGDALEVLAGHGKVAFYPDRAAVPAGEASKAPADALDASTEDDVSYPDCMCAVIPSFPARVVDPA